MENIRIGDDVIKKEYGTRGISRYYKSKMHERIRDNKDFWEIIFTDTNIPKEDYELESRKQQYLNKL